MWDTNHLVFIELLFFLAVIVLILFIVVVLIIKWSMIVTRMKRLVSGSNIVLGIFFTLHSSLSELFHHVDEVLAVVFEKVICDSKDTI